MLLLIGALTIGLILSLLALGVFISFRIFSFPDITADGSIPLGWEVGTRDGAVLAVALAIAVIAGASLYLFFRTNLGTAMQAAGDNPQMIRALGVNVDNMIVLGLALSNGLIALAGGLLTQYQGFADVQMGIGMVVWGLASIIIGEALVGVRDPGFVLIGAVMGSVLFRLIVALALRGGLDPNDLKLITAAFVFIALVLPSLLKKMKPKPAAVLQDT